MTIYQAIASYIDLRTNVLSPSTKREYSNTLKWYFGDIGKIPLSEVNNQIIQKWINDLSYERSPKTVKNIWSLLHATLAEYTPDNHYRVHIPKKRRTRITIPSEQEVSTLIHTCESEDLRIAIILASCMGLRRSEICALKWSDIKKDKYLVIDKAAVMNDQYKIIIKEPKTLSSDRILEIPPQVNKYLSYVRLTRSPRPDSLLVHFRPDQLTHIFCKHKKNHGVDCRFHDLRHYYASVLVALNIPDLYAMEMMGHSTPGMLKKVYQHIMDFKKKESTDKVNAYISSKLALTNSCFCDEQVRVL